jgi:ATP-binding cassette subfamily F protein 3
MASLCLPFYAEQNGKIMLIDLERLGKTFGEKVVLKDVTARVEQDDRIGIIGENGTGKTTLLKILTGEYTDYEGEFSLARDIRLGYLEQNARLDPTLDVYGAMRDAFAAVLDALAQMQIVEKKMAAAPQQEELLSQHAALQAVVDAADGYNMDVNIKKVLNGMGFPQETWQKSVGVLSGGELTRLRLARLLLERPEVLILDEPTNHLDFVTMEWLENYLKSYSGAVLVVSHDRFFLDHVCTKIWEVAEYTLTEYKGNFSAYLPQKDAADALRQKQHDADVALAEKLQDYVDRNLVRASTTKMAQSRRKQLEKLEITEAPAGRQNSLKFRFEYDFEPWNELVILKNLKIEIEGRTLLEPFSYIVHRGERLVIAGPNGTGKSTLMQVLDGHRRPSGGMVRLGSGARPSIFVQQQSRVGGRVIDAIWDKYPKFTELEVRSHLATLGFRGESVFKECSALSGGELARLRFAEIVLERPNLLFLDEPTNHLDIYTRENLTEALKAYTGTLLLVTHDRYLMTSLGCPILYLENGKATLYPSYEALMGRGQGGAQAAEDEVEAKEEKAPAYGKEQRRRRAELRAKVKALEDEMEALGAHQVELENEINTPEVYNDPHTLREKSDDLEDTKARQEDLFRAWEAAVEEQQQYGDDAADPAGT